ncbi:glycoside hydrolase family 18 protein [Calocera cornea HHB12733]|uniref:Glycoside hydrolase family 18 protein n=1 Tax=Calocera cornea HHB12733 TaxID=1353952 RepID=A0A165KB32_9BASI|nr:glycoside hydrolase family 18 protein [Calocera cornea HHB12733]
MVALRASLFLLPLLVTLAEAAPVHHHQRLRARSPCSAISGSSVSGSGAALSSSSTSTSSATSSKPVKSHSTKTTQATTTRPGAPTSTLKTISTSSTSAASTSTSTAAPASDKVVAAYYSDWAADIITPEQVDFDRFNWMDFAFAIPDENFNLQFTEDDSEDLLRRLVKAAHAKGKGVKLSIGGWTGSAFFSSAVSNDANRHTFVQNIANIYGQYNLDGIDIDWEYPGIAAASSSNGASPSDTSNLLEFFKLLRNTLPAGAVLSAAVQDWPWQGEDGSPESDMSAFAEQIDWVTLMNYDVSGSSSTPGANAPLSDQCGNSTYPQANAVAAVAAWTNAKFPADQIVLGVPSYGYVSQSSVNHLYDKRAHIRRALQVTSDAGSTSDGQVLFREVVSQGALMQQGGEWVGNNGFVKHWDDCSATPWLKSDAGEQVITYDDPDSLFVKAQYASQVGLRGVNMFDVSGDTTDWVLTDALRNGLGLS